MDNKMIALAGRLLLGLVFLWTAIANFVELEARIGYGTYRGMPAADILTPIGAIVLLVGTVMVLVGFRPKIGIIILIVFLVPATFILHSYWAVPEAEAAIEIFEFQKNLLIIGALLMLLPTSAAWEDYTVDKYLASRGG